MIPRRKLEIGWSDLLYALCASCWPGSRAAAQARVEALWGDPDAVACLSVRSGFDALLRALAFPPGSEILVSAVTIRDMVRIIEHHGLVPVPLDVRMDPLAVDPESVARAAGPRTRAVLIAHLFGSRMPLDGIAAEAKARGLLLIEDCAQAYVGNAYTGDPRADVSMFSFGPIKTNTALGGAVLHIRDGRIRSTVREIQAGYAVQRRQSFFARTCKYALLKILTYRVLFGAFAAASRRAGRSHDELISAAVRGFAGPDFFDRIRQQPSYPLMRLLERRLRRFEEATIAERTAVAEYAISLLDGVSRPGADAACHTHWIFPIQVDDPQSVAAHLWGCGFDATRGASSLHALEPTARGSASGSGETAVTMREVVYLPVYPGVTAAELQRIAAEVRAFLSRAPNPAADRAPIAAPPEAIPAVPQVTRA